MHDIKLIVTDLDDTFLAGDYAPDMNTAALTHAREEGITVLPCTGRPWLMAEGVIRGYDFDDLCVVSNGAAIMQPSTGTLRHIFPIEGETLLPLLRIAQNYGLIFDITRGGTMAMLASQSGVRRGSFYDGMMDSLAEKGKITLYDTIEEMAEASATTAELVRFFYTSGGTASESIGEELSRIDGIEFARSYSNHVDIMKIGVNKGSALPILADMLGISTSNIMALGDQMNDAPMLQAAGLGIAMGNADERLKVVADCVTDTNKNAGFAKAVYQYAL